ncbi:MAG: lipopolysaccharide biosynthesis protein [Armatimonadota bacterium]|nr:lipopolysaccharide biosynthesis protein [Armatimonadota bacterium]
MSAEHRGTTARALDGMAWTSASVAAQAALQLATLAVLARLLQPRDFGIVAAALVFVGLSAVFSQLGVGPAIVQRPDLAGTHLRVGFTLSVALGVAVASLTWAASPLIAASLQMPELAPVLRALAWLFPIAALSVVSEALLQREMRFRDLAVVDVTAWTCGYAAVAIALAHRGLGVWALVAASLTQAALRTLLLRARRPHPSAPSWDPQAARQLLRFGVGFTLARIANQLAGQADNLVVGARLGPQALGLYGRAYQLMAAPATLFGQVLDKVLFPGMARLQGERERLATAYRRGVTLVGLLALPVSAGVVVLAPEIVAVILGPRWDDAVVPLQILAAGTLCRTSYKISDSLARATGAVYARAWRQLLYAAAVGGGAWLGSAWGLEGVAAGVLAAIALNFLLMAHLSLRLTGLRWTEFAAAHWPGLLAAGVVVGIVWPVAMLLRELETSPTLTIALAGAAALAGAGTVVRCLPGVVLGPDLRWAWRALSSYAASRGLRAASVGDGGYRA